MDNSPPILPNPVYLNSVQFDDATAWVMPIGGAGIRWTIALADFEFSSTASIYVRTVTPTTVSSWVLYQTLAADPPVFTITTAETLQYGLSLDTTANHVSVTATPDRASTGGGALIVDRDTYIDIIQGADTVSVPKVTPS